MHPQSIIPESIKSMFNVCYTTKIWLGMAVQDLDGNGQGGVICTRSCAMKEDGLIDTTVSNIFIPDLGGANSVARPFAIGVNTESVFCKGNDHVKGSYPIRNLVFKNINIQPNPGCSSVLYDKTRVK